MPQAHDACFDCHWKNQKPAGADCLGCHKPAATFVPPLFPARISARFSHEGGKGEHVMECTTCHINIYAGHFFAGIDSGRARRGVHDLPQRQQEDDLSKGGNDRRRVRAIQADRRL